MRDWEQGCCGGGGESEPVCVGGIKIKARVKGRGQGGQEEVEGCCTLVSAGGGAPGEVPGEGVGWERKDSGGTMNKGIMRVKNEEVGREKRERGRKRERGKVTNNVANKQLTYHNT